MDIRLLDSTISAFYGTGFEEERASAEYFLQDLQNKPDTWLQVVQILSNTQHLNTKFFALQVLEDVIKYRWNLLAVEERDGMRNYTSELIVKLSSDEESFRQERVYINKLNVLLVQILKHEWPARWRSFIPDIVAAAKTSESVCINCMTILKLLSEEVFDFSRGKMTQQKIKELKQSLQREFQLVHELCLYVLSASQQSELIKATLATLRAILSWIPVVYIFKSPVIETLVDIFFPIPAYTNLSLQCLTEVATLSVGDFYDMQFVIYMYKKFMVHLQTILPLSTDIPSACSEGTSDEQDFLQNLALFLTAFFKEHMWVLETAQEDINWLCVGLDYLVHISYVDEREVYKVCLEFWYFLVRDLSGAHNNYLENSATTLNITMEGSDRERQQMYSYTMNKLRHLMITCMPMPEEIIVDRDENGNFFREPFKDDDVVSEYKIMRETLFYLSLLDVEDTENQMMANLLSLASGGDLSLDSLDPVCWAIGSISGSMTPLRENMFVMAVINHLFNLTEITNVSHHKAVIINNFMYVVGQYPRCLRANWSILKVFANTLVQFIDEKIPGVVDMACDTFLKIALECKRELVIVQDGENEAYISQLLTTFRDNIVDLEPHQILSFYKAVGHIIEAESDSQKRDEYLQRLMELPNQEWAEIIGEARQDVDFFKDENVIIDVVHILQTNTSVASSLGAHFLSQINSNFLDMLNVYRMCRYFILTSIGQGGPFASRSSFVKLLRCVKKETLKLLETFLDKSEAEPQIRKQFLEPMMHLVLGDYARNVPDARESQLLSLFATIINKYKGAMIEDVPHIFGATFQCTLEMITNNYEDYCEHCLNFFSLLRAIATHTFPALIRLSSEQLKLVMDSIIWAFRHTDRNVAEIGLNLLPEMLKNFQSSEFLNQFYRTYFLRIEQEIFGVLTDTLQKPGFKLHVSVLHHLFCVVEDGILTEPLWDVSTITYPYANNKMYVREYTLNLLTRSFPNMTATEVVQFVDGLFQSRGNLVAFKKKIRDFLVQSKEFSA